MLRIAIALMMIFGLAGCNAAVNDFVDGSKRATNPSINLPPDANAGVVGMKVSPGSVRAANGGVSIQATITPTRRVVKGGGISAEITLGRTRNQ